MRKDMLVFGAPSISHEETEAVVEVMQSGWIGTGPKVSLFERMFCEYKEAEHAVAVNSCTAALHLSLLTLDLKPGDEVITTPLTFCATVNAIMHSGAIPVLADIDIKTLNIDPLEIEKKITARTRAILPVHFAGRPCEMDQIMEIADKNSLHVIEDCAHAVEAKYKGRHVGTFGDFGCFSFYVTKNIITGEGGMVVSHNHLLMSKIKRLALHGMSKDAWKRFGDEGYKHYEVVDSGFKYNMMDLQAAIGIVQLQKLGRLYDRRKEVWDQYNDNLMGLPVTLPEQPANNTVHSHHLYTLVLEPENSPVSRDEFLEEMTRRNIGVGVHYLSIPEHKFYRSTFGWAPEDFPHSMRIGRNIVSIPLSAALSDGDVVDVINAVRSILN